MFYQFVVILLPIIIVGKITFYLIDRPGVPTFIPVMFISPILGIIIGLLFIDYYPQSPIQFKLNLSFT